MKKVACIIIPAILIVSGWYAYSFYTKNNSSSPASTNEEEKISPPAKTQEQSPTSSIKEKNLDAIDTSGLEKEMKTIDEELNNL